MVEGISKNQRRIEWVDLAKGYGMILVILGHMQIRTLGTLINSFHMPLFFFVSGFLFSNKLPLSEFIRRKIKTLIVPYFCLGIVLVLITSFQHYHLNGSIDLLLLVKRLLIQERSWTIWFISCLFILNLVFYVVKEKVRAKTAELLIAVVMPVLGFIYYEFGGSVLPWNLDACAMAFPFFYLGNLYRENEDKVNSTLSTHSLLLLFLSLFVNVACCALSIKISGECMNMFSSVYGFLPLSYIAALCGIVSVIIISKATVSFKLRITKYIGRNSMLFLAWHQTIMFPIADGILMKIPDVYPVGGVIKIVLKLVIVCGLLMVCNEVILRTKLKFIVGK